MRENGQKNWEVDSFARMSDEERAEETLEVHAGEDEEECISNKHKSNKEKRKVFAGHKIKLIVGIVSVALIGIIGCFAFYYEGKTVLLQEEWDIANNKIYSMTFLKNSEPLGLFLNDGCTSMEKLFAKIKKISLGKEIAVPKHEKNIESIILYLDEEGSDALVIGKKKSGYVVYRTQDLVSETKKCYKRTQEGDAVFAQMKEEGEQQESQTANGLNAKPVIYLYPEKKQKVNVTLDNIDFTCTYPAYQSEQSGWNVMAYPDGKLMDEKTNREYYSLYYEGYSQFDTKFSEGAIIAKEEYTKFLEDSLDKLGLTQREAEEFIIYWLPIMQKHEKLLIRFIPQEEQDQVVPLHIVPKPDTTIRVFMQFREVEVGEKIQHQQLQKKERKGYTAVEWGGMDCTRIALVQDKDFLTKSY